MRISMLSLTTLPALLLVSATAPALAETEKRSIMPERGGGFFEQAGFAEAVIAGDFVFLSGVVAGPAPGETDLKPSFDRAFKYIGQTLERAGTSFDNVVDLTTFHTDLQGSMPDLIEVKNRYIKAPFPAWTAIGTTELYSPSAVVEIKIIALLPDDEREEEEEIEAEAPTEE